MLLSFVKITISLKIQALSVISYKLPEYKSAEEGEEEGEEIEIAEDISSSSSMPDLPSAATVEKVIIF